MQEPKKIFFVKKFHRDFRDVPFWDVGHWAIYWAKREGIPNGIPSRVIMKKEKMLSLYFLGGLIIPQDA